MFNENTNNTDVYEYAIKPLLSTMSKGINAACFAYGNTGAGKTHTMFGHFKNTDNYEPGIVFLTLQGCFETFRTTNICIKASYLEIYNENVKDLLNSQEIKGLMIVEDPIKGILVPELREFKVTNLEQIYEIVLEGNRNRTFAATAANELSSRSHAILQLSFEQTSENEITYSKLCMIDLAGSERGSATDNRGQRIIEGAMINKSLLALGNCINILSDIKKRGRYVPYRDSKLTRLLKDSLGGNTKTIMIACIIPAAFAYEDTLQTLKYAQRAKMISTKVSKSIKEVQSDYKEIIINLKSEIETLKIQLNRQQETGVLQEIDEKDDESYENLSRLLRTNFEEHWELKQTLREIETLNDQNKIKLKMTVEQLEVASKHADLSNIEDLSNEIRLVQENIQENEENRNEILQSMYANMKQKQLLQKEMSSVKDNKRRDLLELQIAVRTLKLEKLDIHMQNLNIQQQALESKKISEEKDKIIEEMKHEINQMRTRIKSRENSLVFSNDLEISLDIPTFPLEEIDVKTEKTNSKILYEGLGDTIRVMPSRMCSISPTQRPRSKISQLDEARKLRKSESKKSMVTSKAWEFLDAYKAIKEDNNENEEPVLSKIRSSSVLNRQRREDIATENDNKIVLKSSTFASNKVSTKKGAFSLLYPSIPRSVSQARANSVKKKQPFSSKIGYKPSCERITKREVSLDTRNDENNPARFYQNVRDATQQLIPNKTSNLIRKMVNNKLIPRAKQNYYK